MHPAYPYIYDLYFYKNIMINATIRLFSYIYVRNGLSYIYEIKAPPTSLVLQSAIT